MSALRQISVDFWQWDMPHHRVFGVQCGRRMSIARLPDGSLWLHSPIEPTAQVVASVNALGRVTHIVGPNTFHDAFLVEAQATWPDAALHSAPGLTQANKKLRVGRILSDDPPDSWRVVLDQLVVSGMPALNEVVFLHRGSRTLIIADLAFNLGRDRDAFSRFVLNLYGVLGRFVPSRLLKKAIKDRSATRESLQRILAWDFERIVVGHGAVIESDGKTALRSAYDFLLKDPST